MINTKYTANYVDYLRTKEDILLHGDEVVICICIGDIFSYVV